MLFLFKIQNLQSRRKYKQTLIKPLLFKTFITKENIKEHFHTSFDLLILSTIEAPKYFFILRQFFDIAHVLIKIQSPKGLYYITFDALHIYLIYFLANSAERSKSGYYYFFLPFCNIFLNWFKNTCH